MINCLRADAFLQKTVQLLLTVLRIDVAHGELALSIGIFLASHLFRLALLEIGQENGLNQHLIFPTQGEFDPLRTTFFRRSLHSGRRVDPDHHLGALRPAGHVVSDRIA